jgi:D-beta-D-heptose 7-phosphate kinase/D-beta-D-heptose 1-phosphate adenosyltransferase
MDKDFSEIVDAIKNVRVLVVGDVMLDVYEHCVVKRISPEAPVPIASVVDKTCFLGGAGNVAKNANALGANVSLLSVVGDDEEGSLIDELLHANGINCDGLITEPGRTTTVKRRIVSGTQQLIRIDREMTHEISTATKDAIRVVFLNKIQEHDVVIISDYCKGLLTGDMIEFIKKESHDRGKKIFVDSKNKHFLKYVDVYLIKPNMEEAEHFAGEKFTHSYENLENIGKKLVTMFQSNIVITLGGDGISLFEGDRFTHKKTKAREVFDVSGAGDTVLATIATSVASGASLDDAVHIANHAAGHVVSKLGTTVCTANELKDCFSNDIYE